MKTVHISEYPLHLANQPAFYAASSSFLDQVIAISEQIGSQQICFEIVQRLTTCRLSPQQQALYLCLYTRIYNKIIYPTSSPVASYSLSAEHFIEQALLMSSCSDDAELIDLSPITQYLGTIDDKNYSQFALLSSTPPHRFAKFEKQQFFESMVNFFDTLFRALDSEKKASTPLSLFLALLLEAGTRGANRREANSRESHMLACTIFSLKAHEMFQHLPFEDLEALIEIAEEGQILQEQILRQPQNELPFSLWINLIQSRTDLDKLQKLHLQLAVISHCIPYCHPNQKHPWAMQVVSAALYNHHDLKGLVEPNLISLLGLVDIAALDTLDSAKYLAITAKLTAITQSKTSRKLFYAAMIPSLFNAVEEANPNECFIKYSTFAPLLALQPLQSSDSSSLELLKNILINHLPTTIQETYQQEGQQGDQALNQALNHALDSDLFSETINPFIQHISTCIEMITCPVDWDTLLRDFLELQFQNNLHPNCESLLALIGIIYSFKLKIPFGTSFDSASFSLYLLPLFKNAPEQLTNQLVELSEEM